MVPPLQAMTLALRALAPTCPAQPSCPQDDQCTYTSNDVSLQVSCATDYYGGDFQLTETSTLADCLRACAAAAQCVAVSYVDPNCYMKSTLKPAVSNATVTGGAVLSRSSTSTPTIVVTSTSTAASTTAATSSTSPSSETPIPTNVIVNGGFESPDMSPWYISGLYFDAGRSTSKPHSGKYSFRAHGPVSFLFDVTLSQKVSVVPDTAYNLVFSAKQNIPTCVFSGFYEDVPIFADVKLTSTDYATVAAQIPIFATGFDSGALTIAATGCLGTSVWFDDISMTPA